MTEAAPVALFRAAAQLWFAADENLASLGFCSLNLVRWADSTFQTVASAFVFDPERYDLTEERLATLTEANDALVALRHCRVLRVRASDSPGLATWALRSYRQLWLGRMITLSEGASSEWNAQRLVNVSVLLRAQVENLASFFAIVEQCEALLAAGDLRAFHARVLRAMYGIRQGRDQYPELPEATSVLTLVARLEKLLPDVRRYYEGLCEIVHPNADGLTVFGEVDHDAIELRLTEDLARNSFLVPAVMAGIRMTALGPVKWTPSFGPEARVRKL